MIFIDKNMWIGLSHHHHPDGSLIALVGVMGLCIIEMKRQATPLERNYYCHLCMYSRSLVGLSAPLSLRLYVIAITIRSHCRSRRPSRSKSQASRGQQLLPLFSHCAAWFGFVFSFFLFSFFLMLYATLCAGCTHFHMNAPAVD